MSVAMTLAGDALVLEADDIEAAKRVLEVAAKRFGSPFASLFVAGSHVWITGAEKLDVLSGIELEVDEVEELAGRDATKEDYDRVFQADFVRYRDSLYSLSDFSPDWGITRSAGLPEWMKGWHAYLSDSFYSGLLLRYEKEFDDDPEPDWSGESGVTIATYIIG